MLHGLFEHIDVERFRWAVPLSGGCDSRAILMFLKDRANVEAVTWGTTESREDAESDAAIAKRVAHALGVRHHFFHMDAPKLPIEDVVERYLVAGECRVDHLAGYLDGFHVWQRLHERGFDGCLRGDVCWPHAGDPPATPSCVRQKSDIQLLRLRDYANLPDCSEWELPEQPLSARYEPLAGESLPDYRDRVYQAFRLPCALAALNDLKAAYIEIANPLLSSRFVQFARRLPLPLRHDKELFKRIIVRNGPDLPFARRPAILPLNDIASLVSFRAFMLDELGSDYTRGILSPTLLDGARSRLEKLEVNRSPRIQLRRAGRIRRLARRVRRGMKGPRVRPAPLMPPQKLALRATLISRMCRLLEEDGRCLKKQS